MRANLRPMSAAHCSIYYFGCVHDGDSSSTWYLLRVIFQPCSLFFLTYTTIQMASQDAELVNRHRRFFYCSFKYSPLWENQIALLFYNLTHLDKGQTRWLSLALSSASSVCSSKVSLNCAALQIKCIGWPTRLILRRSLHLDLPFSQLAWLEQPKHLKRR